jgi:hypothetical protein
MTHSSRGPERPTRAKPRRLAPHLLYFSNRVLNEVFKPRNKHLSSAADNFTAGSSVHKASFFVGRFAAGYVSASEFHAKLFSFTLFLLSLFGVRVNAETLPVAVANCVAVSRVDSVSPKGEALVFGGTGELSARVVSAESVSEAAFAGFSSVTIELPGAELGAAAAFAAWETGSFAVMRISRYRSADGCGLRVRLQARAARDWMVATEGSTLVLSPVLTEIERRRRTEVPSGQLTDPSERTSGSAHAAASYSGYSLQGSGSFTGWQLQAGIAQGLGTIGVLRGFVSTFSPADQTGAPYGALGLSGIPLGFASADVVGGDVEVAYGETGGGMAIGSFVPNTLLIRGGGASFDLPGGFRVQGFAGRAAYASLFRLPGFDGVSSEISDDTVSGVQASWGTGSQWLSFGAGFARSVFAAGGTQRNFLQSAEARLDKRASLRLTLEESSSQLPGGDRSGTALTVEPVARLKDLDLGGFVRFLDDGYLPPAGEGFFAGLRRSYSLYGQYRAFDRLSFSAGLGQSKSFSLLDPTDVGSVSSSKSIGVGVQVARPASLSLDYSSSDEVTDPGAVLPANSLTESWGASGSVSTGALGTTVRFGHDRTVNRLSSTLDLDSTRVDVDMNLALTDAHDAYARLRYADSHRIDGQSAGENYSVLAGYRAGGHAIGSLHAEASYSVTPAGIAAFGSKQAVATLGWQSAPQFKLAQASASISYQLLQVDGQPNRQGAAFMLSASRTFGWGERTRPVAPSESRSMPLSAPSDLASSVLDVSVFEDLDGSGLRGKDEPLVPGVEFLMDGIRNATPETGRWETRVPAGAHTVELVPGSLPREYVPSGVARTVAVPRFAHRTLEIPVRPAGFVEGSVVARGTLLAPEALAGLVVRIEGRGVRREAATDDRGSFDLSALPVGDYTVTLDESSLSDDAAVEGPSSVEISVLRRQKARVTFTLHKTSLRERIRGGAGMSSFEFN